MKDFFNNTIAHLTAETLLVKKGTTLFLQNDEVLNMYFITAGRLLLQRNTVDGSQVILQVAFPGEIIAEASLFSKQNRC